MGARNRANTDTAEGRDLHLIDRALDLIEPRSRLCRLLAERLIRDQAEDDLLARLQPGSEATVPLRADRVLLQDYTGIPALVDLASLPGSDRRSRIATTTHLVLDHSTPVETHGSSGAAQRNIAIELQRNAERYDFVRALASHEPRLSVLPPGSGICHQLNLERFAQVAMIHDDGTFGGEFLVGSDSHTTMTNGLGMLGIGVGGIDAVAAMTGASIDFAIPAVHAVELSGSLADGVTAYDLALELVARVRDCVPGGSVLEFNGLGVRSLSAADRATIANLAPEYGVRMALFPVDDTTISDLRMQGRDPGHCDAVRRWAYRQGVDQVRGADVTLPATIHLDLARVRPNIAGPTQPHQVAVLSTGECTTSSERSPVVLAAIASCASTSNPELMLRAGLLARNAHRRGLRTPDHVKTSFSPGSRDVLRYLHDVGLMRPLEELGFHVVAYGCASCDGNSGPLTEAGAVLGGAAVISSNRNFEFRVHGSIDETYLMSPEFVVANAVAGRVLTDECDVVGLDDHANPITFADLRPASAEVDALLRKIRSDSASNATPSESWPDALSVTAAWSPSDPAESRSLYLRRSPFVEPVLELWPAPIADGRPLAWLGDDVTTDHLSPVGAIPFDGEAGRWLRSQGAARHELSTFGSRRANHEVMLRGALSNPSLGDRMRPNDDVNYFTIAEALRKQGHAAVIFAGQRYGSGSSRDWAAKAAAGLGVRAVVAMSIEEIHRRNLIACGVAPILFEATDALNLTEQSRVEIAVADLQQRLVRLRVDDVEVSANLHIASDSEWQLLCSGGRLPVLALS